MTRIELTMDGLKADISVWVIGLYDALDEPTRQKVRERVAQWQNRSTAAPEGQG